jgi:membrane protein implicated in regulation of membrane protease activity
MPMDKIRLWLVTFGVAAVLLFFFSVPLIFILYGGAAGVVGGAIMLAPFIAVQYLFLVLFRRLFRTASKSDKQ